MQLQDLVFQSLDTESKRCHRINPAKDTGSLACSMSRHGFYAAHWLSQGTHQGQGIPAAMGSTLTLASQRLSPSLGIHDTEKEEEETAE